MNQNNNNKIIENLKPSAQEFNIEDLLNNIEKFIEAHTILPKGCSTAIVLWCLATYCINAFGIFPKLVIYSPEKRCGKSTLLDLLEAFCFRSFFTSNISVASIYRAIEEYQPTLIIDEADTFIAKANDDMVGIINSGHAKNRAFVTRCDGDNHIPRKYSTWSPMALASIGFLQPTIMDRSIAIQLKRKTQKEHVQRIPVDLLANAKKERAKLLKWSIDNESLLKSNPVEPPQIGNDRAVDNWLPLFTIAKQISPAWLAKCEEAYRLLNDAENEMLPSTLLLKDIRSIFKELNEDKISSADLISELLKIKDHPWCEWKNGRSISQNGLATLLKPYRIKPKGIRCKGNTPRGYELKQFEDAFVRYLC